jgi:hypothetical protein
MSGRSRSMNVDKSYLFGEPVMEIIRRRRSVRTYSKLPIPADIKEKLHQYFRQLKGPFQARIRFGLLDKLEIKTDAKIKLGTYGVIQGASSFIAAAVEKKEHSLEHLGYVFENLILYLTSLGLGTCWMAGTFNKSQFSKAMRIRTDEILPIVTPVGYASEKRSLIEILMKPSPNLKKRKTWNELFFKDSFNTPLDEADAGAYAMPLEMVRLAPSASNKQPWRIIKTNGHFHFYLAHNTLYTRMYPYDIQKIDMGIAMFHFESTANESGLKGRWEIQTPALVNVHRELEYIITWVSE